MSPSILLILALPLTPLAGSGGVAPGARELAPPAAASNLAAAPLSLDALLAADARPRASASRAALQRDPRGFYVKGFGGVGLLGDEDVDFDDGTTLTEGEGEFDAGFLTGLALGYRFDRNWALEAEFAYRTNDVDIFEAGGTALANGGDYASTALLLNGFYHFDSGLRFDPYIGAGFGMASEIDIDLEGGSFGGGQSFSGDSPAGQVILGAQGALTEDLDLFVEGRFFRAFDPEMDEEGNPGVVESEYGHTALVLGLSWSF